MPAVHIEVRRADALEEEVAIIEAVHAALVTAFQIPPDDRDLRLTVHEPHRFSCSPRTPQPELRTLVSIDCFAGRSIAAKRTLYREIVTRLAALGIPEDHVSTIIREIPTENWGVVGGHAASDVDLGFDLDV